MERVGEKGAGQAEIRRTANPATDAVGPLTALVTTIRPLPSPVYPGKRTCLHRVCSGAYAEGFSMATVCGDIFTTPQIWARMPLVQVFVSSAGNFTSRWV